MGLLNYRCRILFGICFLILFPFEVSGQHFGKKKLTEADYGKWGTLWVNGLSDKGNWTSYEMAYESHKDTLFLQHTVKDLRYMFAGGQDEKFAGEKLFGCLVTGDVLKLVNLKTKRVTEIAGVTQFEFAAGDKYLIAVEQSFGGLTILKVRDFDGKIVNSIPGIQTFVLNPTKDMLLFSAKDGGKNSIGILEIADGGIKLLPIGAGGVTKQITWQADGNAVAMVRGNILYYYRLKDNILFTFDADDATHNGGVTGVYGNQSITISDDGTKVFFKALKGKTVTPENGKVEVWEGADNQLYASKQWEAGFGEFPKLACWFPENGKVTFVSRDALPNVLLSPDWHYAVLWNQFAYAIEPSYPENVDYILKDIASGAERLVLKKHPNDENQIGFSPDGKRLLYYKDKNWWVYEIGQNIHLNITKGIAAEWDNTSSNAPHQFDVYGNPGWRADGRSVLLYDAFDLWSVAIDGKSCKRLTNGREKEVVFRIDQSEYNNKKRYNFNGRSPVVFDLSAKLLLTAHRELDYFSGYYLLDGKTLTRRLVFDGFKNESVFKSQNNRFVYTRQNFEQTPQLIFMDGKANTAKTLFESNVQQRQYRYGKAELIQYQNSKREMLKAALIYPADYDSKLKYAMVVNVYDEMSRQLNNYVNPSYLNEAGFNVTNFSLNGYFVLLPDINYELGDPGVSAADCVTAAVNEVLTKGIVDDKKIGLIGHSFGGYETDYILTQSKLFAAAVSGAGVSDTFSFYLSLDHSKNIRTQMWRFESQQWRMGKSLFDDVGGYLRNSPIVHAGNITTPTLLWAGKKDRVINMEQSLELYIALRRLGVETKLLLYPDEEHTLANEFNQKDLTLRIQEWFDAHLK